MTSYVIKMAAAAGLCLSAGACTAKDVPDPENKTPMDYTADGLIDFSRFHFKLHETTYADVHKALGEPARSLVVGGVALGATYYFPHTTAPPPKGVPEWSFAFAKNQNFHCDFSFTDHGKMDSAPMCDSHMLLR